MKKQKCKFNHMAWRSKLYRKKLLVSVKWHVVGECKSFVKCFLHSVGVFHMIYSMFEMLRKEVQFKKVPMRAIRNPAHLPGTHKLLVPSGQQYHLSVSSAVTEICKKWRNSSDKHEQQCEQWKMQFHVQDKMQLNCILIIPTKIWTLQVVSMIYEEWEECFYDWASSKTHWLVKHMTWWFGPITPQHNLKFPKKLQYVHGGQRITIWSLQLVVFHKHHTCVTSTSLLLLT